MFRRLRIGPERYVATAESQITTMERDKCQTDRIIYADGYAIKELQDNKSQLVVGNALKRGNTDGVGEDVRLESVTGLFQVTCNRWYMAIPQSHCIKLLDVPERNVSVLAGYCTISNHNDGDASSARFKSPSSIVSHINSVTMLLITDRNRIRSMDKQTAYVGTVYEVEFRDIRFQSMDWYRNSLIVVTRTVFVQLVFNYLDVVATNVTSLNRINWRGPLVDGLRIRSSRRLGCTIQSVNNTRRGLILVSCDNYWRLLDLANNKLTSLCQGPVGCGVNGLKSMAFSQKAFLRLYTGTNKIIHLHHGE